MYNPDGQIQIYIQNSKKGKDISAFNDAEKEVVYMRESAFAVLNVVEVEDKFYILLEEKV